MLILALPTDRLDVSADLSVMVHASYVDLSGAMMIPGRQNTTALNLFTVVTGPPSETYRNIKALVVHNNSPGSAAVVEVIFNQNGTTFSLIKLTLQPLKTLGYAEDTGFYVR
jgi:hypothetical protein